VLREALYCIRCGACLNVCAPYQAVGGHVFGGDTYQSGIGNAWEAGVTSLEAAAEFNGLCTTCSRCRDVCPVNIDIPWMNADLRHRIRGDDKPGRLASLLLQPDRLYRAARRGAPLRALANTAPARGALERMLHIDHRRPLPEIAPRTLAQEYVGRGGRLVQGEPDAGAGDLPAGAVLFWADCHTNHLDVEAGLAALEVLEALDFDVRLIAGPCCGRAAFSQGALDVARDLSGTLVDELEPWISAGAEIVGLEPSCVTCVTDDAQKLLGEESNALLVGMATKEVMRFIEDNADRLETLLMAGEVGMLEESAGEESEALPPQERSVIVHGHCQQKTAGWYPATLSLLSRFPGTTVRSTLAECCGMAGSFGYKPEWYAVSRELGERLVGEIDALERDGGPADEVLACGTSCRAQLSDVGGRRPRHPVELLADLVRAAAARAPGD
jgi:Fe-S oxidoreductase